jgi:hypothetical protein
VFTVEDDLYATTLVQHAGSTRWFKKVVGMKIVGIWTGRGSPAWRRGGTTDG